MLHLNKMHATVRPDDISFFSPHPIHYFFSVCAFYKIKLSFNLLTIKSNFWSKKCQTLLFLALLFAVLQTPSLLMQKKKHIHRPVADEKHGHQLIMLLPKRAACVKPFNFFHVKYLYMLWIIPYVYLVAIVKAEGRTSTKIISL